MQKHSTSKQGRSSKARFGKQFRLPGVGEELFTTYRDDSKIVAALATQQSRGKDNLLDVSATASRDEDRRGKFIIDGLYNDWPNYCHATLYGSDTMASSPIAGAMLAKKIQFVSGNGFTEQRLQDLVVNSRQTFAEIHKQIAADFTTLGRFAIKIHYTKDSMLEGVEPEVAAIEHVPAERLRIYYDPAEEKPRSRHVVYNPLFGDPQYDANDNVIYPTFDPSRAKEDFEGGHKCQIYYFQNISGNNRAYSRPSWWSAQDAIRVDAGMYKLHERNLANNFFLGALLYVVGDPDRPIEVDSDGHVRLTFGEDTERKLHDMAAGAENAGSILTFYGDTSAAVPQVVNFPVNSNDTLYSTISNQVRDVISIAFQVPRILAGIETGGKLGDSNEVRNAMLIANEATQPERDTLESVYAKILPYLGYVGKVEIVPKRMSVEIPTEVWDWLPDSVKRDVARERYDIDVPDELQDTTLNE